MDWGERRKVMKDWASKLWRSGYPATTRHQVAKESIEKYERMCTVEDKGGRPVNRAREWKQAARRLEKETKTAYWHKTSKN